VKIAIYDSTHQLSAYFKLSIKRAAHRTLEMIPKSILQSKLRAKKDTPLNTYRFSISIIGNRSMKLLNNKYRKKNYPTDVLSFSIFESEGPRIPSLDLGDILICLPVAKKQAREYQESLRHELERLTVHGVLHLFGYDHEKSKKEEKQMFSLQNKILRSLSD